jgi:hypothetical protein
MTSSAYIFFKDFVGLFQVTFTEVTAIYAAFLHNNVSFMAKSLSLIMDSDHATIYKNPL